MNLRLLVLCCLWYHCSLMCCHQGHKAVKTSTDSGAAWVFCSSTFSLLGLQGLGCCYHVHHLCSCFWVVWRCWLHHCQGYCVHRYCCWWTPLELGIWMHPSLLVMLVLGLPTLGAESWLLLWFLKPFVTVSNCHHWREAGAVFSVPSASAHSHTSRGTSCLLSTGSHLGQYTHCF